MSDIASYSAVERLRDGTAVKIRIFRPEDSADFLSAVDRVGPRSRYLRFFALKDNFTEREKSFFLNIDLDKHVALIALIEEHEREVIVGSGRYVVVEPGKAEVAFAVIDKYQGRGIGSILLRHLIAVARIATLHTFIAEVLPENVAMLKVFEQSGLRVSTTRDPQVVHITANLN